MNNKIIFVLMPVVVLFILGTSQGDKAEAFEILCEPYPGTSFVYDISDLDERWHDNFEKALDKWRDLANVHIDIAPGNGTEIEVKVNMESHKGAEWAGLGRCGIENNPHITINSYHVKSEAQFMRVAVHEIGHTLGLYHSEDPYSVMSIENLRTSLPNEDDIEGLVYIYGEPLKNKDSGNGSPYPCEPPYPELRSGDSGSCAQYLQWIMNKDRDSINKLTEDGKVNRTMIKIARRHQFLNGMSKRSVIDPETWNYVLGIDRRYVINGHKVHILDSWLVRYFYSMN